jgi:hypothetical protein
VLAGAGLGDDARLAHAPRQQGLADGVVDLVRAGVVEVLALEVDLRAAELAAQCARRGRPGWGGRRSAPARAELGQELGVVLVFALGVGGFS